ncbi:MAG: bifunctional riboflavin kinase/FAD synthetase [Chloroflexota bacterium]
MAVTIGVFDGVHLGHKQLLSRLKELAAQKNLLTGVITFRQHPQEVLSPHKPLPCLTSLEQRIELIKAAGIDTVIPLSFTPEMANLTAREFVSLLKKYLRLKWLVIGPDFALGREREGSAAALSQLGKEMGFGVTAVPPMKIKGEVVSSTVIRKALAEGDMSKVRRLIGRPFRLKGTVVAGVGRGTGLGFPTANIQPKPELALPGDGVYATLAYVGDKTYPSVTNIGKRPTFKEKGRTIEAHLLDFQGDLYGQKLTLEVVERIRGEQRFASAEELQQQIKLDIEKAREIL